MIDFKMRDLVSGDEKFEIWHLEFLAAKAALDFSLLVSELVS